ncbi:pectate lyase family protein [Longitalea arenae]|uniref:pectate lyase family protein n=1 Tax=Longitalea arenae TaxID=2812558 RepID=UPI0019678954|nr:pectate lyase [Longitalea arenae]
MIKRLLFCKQASQDRHVNRKIMLVILHLILFADLGAQPLAFPGAEGFGQYTTGGRGGKVFVVTTLNDDGPGSFRKAVQAKEPRIIVFAVSGTIHLQSKLEIKGNATIAGQTAPGDGICLADHPVALAGDNIIIRYLRFRMGDKNQRGGMVDGSGSDDAFGGTRRKNIIIDHCSMSWSTDEVFSVYNGDSTTLQWNLIAEPLNYSYHFEAGDKDFERHGYGGIWGGKHLSAHHNLFAHCNSRNPRFNGTRQMPDENVDYRNNVIYNWGGNNVYAGEGGNYNVVNNYYKYGPNTHKNVMHQVVNPWSKPPGISYGKFFVEGNYVDGSKEVTSNNWLGVRLGNSKMGDDPALAKATAPFTIVPVTTQLAQDAYELVLKHVGCSLPNRDTLDARIVNDVKNRTGRLIDVQGGYQHGTPYEATVNAWPGLQSTPAAADKDQDGMPDAWEIKHKLNPADAGDAAGYKLDKQYTNIEMYINGLGK